MADLKGLEAILYFMPNDIDDPNSSHPRVYTDFEVTVARQILTENMVKKFDSYAPDPVLPSAKNIGCIPNAFLEYEFNEGKETSFVDPRAPFASVTRLPGNDEEDTMTASVDNPCVYI